MFTIPLVKPDLPPLEAIEDAFREILANGKITNFGPHMHRFEESASVYLGGVHVAATSSCTTGLVLALGALGVEPGQKVILPSFTFMAAAQAVYYAQGIPLFADIDDDLTLSPDDLKLLLEQHSDVAAVLPVHTYGLPCKVDAIQQIVDDAAKHVDRPIAVLYDAAHAFGSALGARRVGGFGSAEVFSFSATKVLVSVEGGMVASYDADVIRRIRKMRNYGIESNYHTYYPGLNGKMTEFHALIGLYNLARLDDLLAERQSKARYYRAMIQRCTSFQTLPWPPEVTHTWKDFTILVPEGLAGQRDGVIAHLHVCGIETRTYFSPPLHEQQFFRRYADRPLPRTEALAARVITLPFYTSISEDEIHCVVNELMSVEQSLRP